MAKQIYVLVSHSQGWEMSVVSTHPDREAAVEAFRARVEKNEGGTYAEIQQTNEEEGLDCATLVDDSAYVNYGDNVEGFGIVALDV